MKTSYDEFIDLFGEMAYDERVVPLLDPKPGESQFHPSCTVSETLPKALLEAYEDYNWPGIKPVKLPFVAGYQSNKTILAFIRLQLAMSGCAHLADMQGSHDFQKKPKESFDVIFCPSSLRRQMPDGLSSQFSIGKKRFRLNSNDDYFMLLHFMNYLSDKGRMAIWFPLDALVRQGTSKRIREALVVNDYIDAVLYESTSEDQNVLILLNKNKPLYRKNKIVFRDSISWEETIDDVLDYEDAYNVDVNDVVLSDYNINPLYYCSGLIDRINSIRSLCANNIITTFDNDKYFTIYRPPKQTGMAHTKKKVISIHDLTDMYIALPALDPTSNRELLLRRSKSTAPYVKSIVVSLKPNSIKASIYDPQNTNGYPIHLDQDLFAIIPNNGIINIEYLYYLLNSDIIGKQIQAVAGVVEVNLNVFKSFRIPVTGSLEEQTRIKNELIKSEIQSRAQLIAGDEIESVRQDSEFQIVRHLAHNLAPRLASVDSVIRHFSKFIESKGLIDSSLQETFFEGQPSETVSLAISKAQFDIEHVQNLIKDTRKVIAEEILPEDFACLSLKELFDIDIKPKYADRQFSMIIRGGERVSADLHKTSFVEMIDNFIRNAEIHGFRQPDKSYQVIFKIYADKDKVVLDYKNNGDPFPADFTKEGFLSFGNKRSDSPGEGLGGAFINKVIRAHRGSFEILKGDNWHPVRFKITIPIRRNI